ncbi:hypothetical protein ACNKHK_20680 [Shigella flexneri]
MNEAVEPAGCESRRNGSLHIDARDADVFCAPYDLVKTMRASIWALGRWLPLWSGPGFTTGGCTIGARPVDLHITGLAAVRRDYQAGRRLRESVR